MHDLNRLSNNQRMVDEAVAIGSSRLVALGGGLDPGDRDMEAARQRALDGFAELLPYVREAGIVLALEPLHPMVCATRSVLCTLRQANDWCDALGGGPEVGIAVDTYNVWWDPELEFQIERSAGRIAAYHVSDWLPDTRDLRFDRGMPGDGVIDFRRYPCARSIAHTPAPRDARRALHSRPGGLGRQADRAGSSQAIQARRRLVRAPRSRTVATWTG